jgi:two-component system cell cycle response regulator
VAGGAELLTVTISVGVASGSGDDGQVQTLLKRADEAVYVAKAEGRNRVIARAAA